MFWVILDFGFLSPKNVFVGENDVAQRLNNYALTRLCEGLIKLRP